MICIFLAEGFEEMEAIAPIDLLRRAGIEVQTVGVGAKTVMGSHGISLVCDIADSEINSGECDGVILPGGPGRTKLAESPVVRNMLAAVSKRGGLLAAICGSPPILGEQGYLRDRKACCYSGLEDGLTGAQVLFDPVVIDGNVITSRGAGTATQFALALVEYLVSPEMAAEIAAQIQYGR